MIGVINVYKEAGWTSHDVVAKIKRLSRCKAGHTGTLDPNACGVLPVCLGSATKLADYIMGEDKEYEAEIIFGIATDTLDSTGQITATASTNFNKEQLLTAINGFLGKIQQLPPMYAAIKIGGKKLYELAREGKTIKRTPRDVTIHKIEVLALNLPRTAKIRVSCSKGTYIRSLCADIGEALGTHAHMGELTRTRSGIFYADTATTIGELIKLADEGRLNECVSPIEAIFPGLQKVTILPSGQKFLINGNPINPSYSDAGNPFLGEIVLTYSSDGKLCGLHEFIQKNEDVWLIPKVML